MTYEETLSWIHGTLRFGMKPGVKRMLWMLEQLDNPHQKVKAVHVVGTNGKGSTVNYLQTILTMAGYDVGTFTSPYIMDFRERIAVNGEMISREDLVAVATVVRPIVERLPFETDLGPATEFEIITLMMFVYFGQQRPVDIAIIEAGLGGLHDSTNVFKALAVICPSIGLDHQDILGATYEAIAQQKAGVLTGGEPFIFAADRSEVREVFRQAASDLRCPVYELGQEVLLKENGRAFQVSGEGFCLSEVLLSMPGEHQRRNAALVVMLCQLLKTEYPKVTDAHILKGLAEAKWLGRTEWMGPNLMIDGAHNDESIQALVAVLQSDHADKRVHILFSAIDTKPITSMLEQLSIFESVTVTQFDYPNSVPLDKYPDAYSKVADFRDWLAKTAHGNADELFVVTGSLYFISQVRQKLLETSGI